MIPAEMISRPNWVRWVNKLRNGIPSKMPITLEGRAASSIDPNTWTTYEAAQASSRGDGLGFVLNGDGLACLDLDHCLTDGVPSAAAQRVLDRFPTAWVEVSPSGDGLHVWGSAKAQPGRKTVIDGLNVEFYSRYRYMTVTGNTYRAGGLAEVLSR